MTIPPITTSTVLRTLEKIYSPPLTFLNFKTPFQLLIATILSAQCTDKMINSLTPKLFAKYKGPADFLTVPEEELQSDIRSSGHFRNKAKYIRLTCGLLLDQHGGDVPSTMEELLMLPGVGRKTATVVLYAAFRQQHGIAVDTHVWRVSKRLGLTKGKTQNRIELDLMNQTPREEWGQLHTLLISHGRAVCTARNRQCEKCVFQKDCPSSKVMGREDLAKD